MASHDVPSRIDHVGIAVPSIDDAEPFLLAVGCRKLLEESVDGQFTWAYYRLGGASRLELLSPVADDTFLTRFLDANGPGLHHVTIEVADIDRVIEHLESEGIRVVDYTERPDWTEAFLSPSNPSGTLFQLMEYEASYQQRRSHVEHVLIGGCRVGKRDAP